MDASTVVGRMTPKAPTATSTTYRLNLHTPRKPSPLNPAAHKPISPVPADERQSRETQNDAQRDSSRRARTVSPTQKILRRKAAKTLQTNTLRRQVEAYEARALQSLATKASTTSKKHTKKKSMDTTLKIGITVTAPANQQPSRKKRRRRWGALLMFFRTRPVVTALGSLWPFDSGNTTPALEWQSGEQQPPAAVAPAA